MSSVTMLLRTVRRPARVQIKGLLLLGQVGVGALIIAVWWAAAHFRWLSAEILPTPDSVVRGLVYLVGTPTFWLAVLHTLSSAVIGLVLAILVAVPIGLVLGLAPKIEFTTRFLVDLGRSFPVIALLPVMILLLGATAQMEITVIFIGVFWKILMQTIYGSRRMDPVVRDTTRSYQVNTRLRFLKVLLPSAAPYIATGIRVSASLAILLAIGVEMLGRTPGMGLRLSQAQIDGRPDLAFGYVVVAGLMGVTINFLLMKLEERVLVWNARADVEAS